MPNKDQMGIDTIASILTVFTLLITVEYTDGHYDIWDCLLAVLILWICFKFKTQFSSNATNFLIVRVGLSVSIMILIVSLVSSLNSSLIFDNEHPLGFRFVDIYFLIALFCFGLSFGFYRK